MKASTSLDPCPFLSSVQSVNTHRETSLGSWSVKNKSIVNTENLPHALLLSHQRSISDGRDWGEYVHRNMKASISNVDREGTPLMGAAKSHWFIGSYRYTLKQMDKMGQYRAKDSNFSTRKRSAMIFIISAIPGAEADWLPPVPWWLVITLSMEDVEKVWPWPECGGTWAE